MKKLNAKELKTLKLLHIIYAMLWTVGVLAMVLLLLLEVQSGDELFIKYKAVRLIDNALVIPSAIITVLIGIFYGIKTNWGFFKFKWITVKWIVSIIIILGGTFYLSPLLDTNLIIADEKRDTALSNTLIDHNESTIFIIGCCSSILLLVLVGISVFKPWKNK